MDRITSNGVNVPPCVVPRSGERGGWGWCDRDFDFIISSANKTTPEIRRIIISTNNMEWVTPIGVQAQYFLPHRVKFLTAVHLKNASK
jgi:hypothetical protein